MKRNEMNETANATSIEVVVGEQPRQGLRCCMGVENASIISLFGGRSKSTPRGRIKDSFFYSRIIG